MLNIVGERTSMIYLGCFVVTSALTLFMAHTAVAATIYPLLLAIYALYGKHDKPTRFGKGLFIGMAYVAGAGSIITLLGAARGAVAISFYKEIVGEEITFFGLTYYMLPVGVIMTMLLWCFFMVFFKPEKKRIPGLREKARELNNNLGRITRNEVLAAVIVVGMITVMSLRSLVPAMAHIDKSAIILVSTVLFFLFKILDTDDLEQVPWNIILLFGGAMSIGYCLYETGAAQWLAINWLTMFENSHWFVFIMGLSVFVLFMTNFIMNVAAISISIPVALVIAPYLGVAPNVVLFSALVVAGMPFLLLVGAAPNAIAYDSKQFTSGEFFLYGLPASVLLLIAVAFSVLVLWPLMGMPILLK
jgi:sodium-dependent dicarboxylate transporter 2/3/5